MKGPRKDDDNSVLEKTVEPQFAREWTELSACILPTFSLTNCMNGKVQVGEAQ